MRVKEFSEELSNTQVADLETEHEFKQVATRADRTLDVELHQKYLLRSLEGQLSARMIVLDASRPWILYWILNALALLGHDVTPYRPRVVNMLRQYYDYQSGGGFGGGFGQKAHLLPTYAATLCLALVKADAGHMAFINRDAMRRWLLRCKNADGSYRAHESGETDSRSVYCALVVARLLDIADAEVTRGCAEWLARCQAFDGGFSGEPGTEAHGGYCYCTMAALRLLQSLASSETPLYDHGRLRYWLSQRQTKYGGFNGRTNKLVDGCYSWWIGGSWLLEGANVAFDRRRLAQYIVQYGQSATGGLRDKPSASPDFYHTCYVLLGLSAATHSYTWSKGSCFVETYERVDVGLGPVEIAPADPIFAIPVGCAEHIYRVFHNEAVTD